MIPISMLMTDDERRFEPPSGVTPEAIFIRNWAEAVMETALGRLDRWCEEQGRQEWYAIFMAMRAPANKSDSVSQRAMAHQRGLSRDQVRYALTVMEERFSEILRLEIAAHVRHPEEIDEAILELQAALQG